MPQQKGSEKRIQVDKDKTAVFVAVACAAVAVIVAILLSRAFLKQAGYYGKVADIKGAAVKQLESNKQAVSALKASFETFNNQSTNLLGAATEGTGPLNGDNATLVLDALPSKYDFPALTSSVERILAGYQINGLSGVDDSLTQQNAGASSAVEIPFSTEVLTSYDGFKELLGRFDRSIRPFQISTLELTGTNATLQVSMNLKTFYQPETGLQIQEKQVP